MNVNLPKSFILTAVKAELASFAYNKTNNSISYVSEFVSDASEKETIKAKVSHYPMGDADEHLKSLFTTPVIEGGDLYVLNVEFMENPDVSEEDLIKACDMVTTLHNFIDNHSCINTMSPLYNTEEVQHDV